MKQMKLLLCTASLFTLAEAQAQNLYVKKQSGQQTSYALTAVSTITFSPGVVHVNQNNATTNDYELTELRYINFKDLTTDICDKESQQQGFAVSAYPNPTAESLNINLLNVRPGQKIVVEVFSIDGKRMQAETLAATASGHSITISVAHLQQGLYFCKVATGNTYKTIKFIKYK